MGEGKASNGSPRRVSTQGQGARPTRSEPQGRLSAAPPLKGGPKPPFPQNQGTFPLRRSGKSLRWWTANEPRCVLSLAGLRGPGRARGRGRVAAVGSKATTRTTWAGDSVLPAAAAARRALGLVARRAAWTAEPDARSRRHGHQNGRVAGGRPGRQRPGAQLADR